MLFKLLALPLSLPAAGIKFCFQQLLNTAENELTDDEPVKEALLLLTLQLEEGEIGEAEFAREEAVLHARLR
ncbi:MAG: gas vesicle protein GvpG, partial [Chloroflexota bacterium]